MKNILTREEVVEQFGHILLHFDFFCGNTFAFSSMDKLGFMVILYIKSSNMTFVGAKSSITAHEAIQNVPQDVRFLILDKDLQIIYED